MKRVLIIKLGYSETLASFLNLGISLGDVLRTTFILSYFKDWDISWLVDKKALPLLEGNPYINRILIWSLSIKDKLKKEKFDLIINFENLPQVFEFVKLLNAEKCLGFSVDGFSDSPAIRRLIEISKDSEAKKKNTKCWQEILADAINKKWAEERYVLGYQPRSSICYDLGFNWTTSNKWSNKAWPKEKWRQLEELLRKKYKISWQKGLRNLYEYIDWINSCRIIITADTLGLHLALALGKRVIALFGPTSPYEVYFYGLGSFITPDSNYKCIPCFKLSCDKKRPCMEYIAPENVRKRIEDEFKKIETS